ncbi:alkylation response protein AidB-like acyl-CoA dehydrogenase [Glutamicibacter mysorens]|uniref:Alkylation response protein AidB-like acyl-CoA dehydrogenase n=1 Tax=Glutamicibacter mysorens TaxID=257984 RepID=A0ABX4MZY6_9MICC|nr:alkylation response protein AidB-like acyl-CoA dehydrogenase [Glutamicibacter mysorens]
MSTVSINNTIEAPSMEFSLDEEQAGLTDLAAQIFSSLSTDGLYAAGEQAGAAYDEALWGQVVESGLIDALLPMGEGEPGLGMAGLALVAREQGRALGRIPFISTAVAALAITEFGGHEQLLEGISSGSVRIAALQPEVRRRVNGTASGDGWMLDGAIELGYLVPSATHLMVQFHTGTGQLTALIEKDRAGISVHEYRGLSRQQHAELAFTGVQLQASDLIGAEQPAGTVSAWIRPRLLTAAAALMSGVGAEALRRTAAYTNERKQFGRAIATNQGVALRAADAFIDTETTWLSTIDAAWQLDHDGDGAEAAFGASWLAREAGFRVVHTTQHLHGGMGADLDNHIHRFFVWMRELDVLWGTAGQVSEELAAVILDGEQS